MNIYCFDEVGKCWRAQRFYLISLPLWIPYSMRKKWTLLYKETIQTEFFSMIRLLKYNYPCYAISRYRFVWFTFPLDESYFFGGRIDFEIYIVSFVILMLRWFNALFIQYGFNLMIQSHVGKIKTQNSKKIIFIDHNNIQ